MKRRNFLATTGLALALAVTSTSAAWAENATLKIGFVGVTSGPAAAWGISNQRSMEARAAWLNELGGVEIGGTTYNIEIVPFDDQKDPKRAIAGMENHRVVVGAPGESRPTTSSSMPAIAMTAISSSNQYSRTRALIRFTQ